MVEVMDLAQVLTPDQARAYLTCTRAAGIDPLRVSGFAVAYRHIARLTPAQVLATVGAEHPTVTGAPQVYDPENLYMLIFPNGPDVRCRLSDSMAVEMHGTLRLSDFADPFRGNGFTAASQAPVPEYFLSGSSLLAPGAALVQIGPDGRNRVLAVLGGRPDGVPTWLPPARANDYPVTAQPDEHQLFVRLGGRPIPAYQVSGDEVGVLAPDSRAAWLCYPSAASLYNGPDYVLSIYPLEHVNMVSGIVTVARWRGTDVIVERFDGRTADILRLGKPLPGMAEAGFAGDQYHGFRATVPRSDITDLSGLVDSYMPGQRPLRPESQVAAPLLPGENRRFHTSFLAEAGTGTTVMLAGVGPDGRQHRVIQCPDRRAVSLMILGTPEVWDGENGEVVVPVDGGILPDAHPVEAVTRITIDDGSDLIVDGVDGTGFVAQRFLDEQTLGPYEVIPPQRVVRRWDGMWAPNG